MDNKKWYKRFMTIFWCSLTILPFLLFLSAMLMAVGNLTLNHQTLSSSEILLYIEDIISSNAVFDICFEITGNMALPGLTNMFKGLFNNLGLAWYVSLGCAFGYMVSIQLYHVLFDFIVWLPHMCHEILEKWC